MLSWFAPFPSKYDWLYTFLRYTPRRTWLMSTCIVTLVDVLEVLMEIMKSSNWTSTWQKSTCSVFLSPFKVTIRWETFCDVNLCTNMWMSRVSILVLFHSPHQLHMCTPACILIQQFQKAVVILFTICSFFVFTIFCYSSLVGN